MTLRCLASVLFLCLAAQAKKPNFVFFLVDDLGLGDVGCFGSQFHETPHIDRLAADGMKFTQGYSACTVCSPSRAAILLGKYPGRTNLTDWIAGHRRGNPKLLIPKWNMRMALEETTLPEALGEAGYRSQFVGKWHLMPIGAPDFKEHFPQAHGFEGNVGGREWGQPKGKGKFFSPYGMPGLDDGQAGDFLTTSLTDAAIDFIESAKDDPFLLYFSYYTVHGPIMAPPALVEKYKKKAASFENTNDERVNPAFAGMMELLDDSVGRVRATLKDLGLDDNTVVIFTADNGGTSEKASAGLRGAKALSYEGGTRVSTLVSWPGVTAPGSICDVPVIGNDFYPTMLEIAGLPLRPEQHADGQSLVPLLKQDGVVDRNSLFWHYPHYHRTPPYGAVRTGDWKLIEFFEEGKLELYNLADDPSERSNLAATHPEKAQAMLKRMQTWRQEVGAQMPTPNPNYNPNAKAAPRRKRGKSSGKTTQPVATPIGKVSASSNESGNLPENVTDGDARTRWAADGGSVPQWIQLEFSERKALSGLDIHWKNQTWFRYQVEVSDDGKAWKRVAESATKEARRKDAPRFEAKAKFLRLTVTDLGSGWVSITELQPKPL